MNLTMILVSYLALLFSLVIHEYAHALTAYILGDETAERAGRLTLNPIAHADLIGTVILPLAAISTGLPVFGWAKPVPYNPYNLKDQKWGPVKVALAGPLSNFGLAAIFLLVLRYILTATQLDSSNLMVIFLLQMAIINIVLGIFNLIPVPPLDGSKLLRATLTHPKYRQFLIELEMKGPRYLMIFILADAFLNLGILGRLFRAAIGGAFALFGLA